MKKTSIALIRIACMAGILAVTLTSYAIAAAKKGQAAPNFTLTSIDGKTMSLAHLRNDPSNKNKTRVVLLDFWSTGCPPCVDGLPFNQSLHKKYATKGLAVVGVALDPEGSRVVKPFVKERKITYTMLCDANANVARLYGIRFTPTVFIIDKRGTVHTVHVGAGPDTETMIENTIKTLLK